MTSSILKLPLELVSHIVSFLPGQEPLSPSTQQASPMLSTGLSSFATISRQWQYAIERRTFERLLVQSHAIGFFSKIVVGHRRALLRVLDYDIILPKYSVAAYALFETEKEQDANSKAFSGAISAIFAILKSWENDHSRTPSDTIFYQSRQAIQLRITKIFSPTDNDYNEKQFAHEMAIEFSRFEEYRYTHSVIKFIDVENLPELSNISSFVFKSLEVTRIRHVEPKSIAYIASKFSIRLEHIHWEITDFVSRDVTQRQKLREDFAQALKELKIDKLRFFELGYMSTPPSNHNFDPPRAYSPKAPNDSFSMALHQFSQGTNLTSINLGQNIVISTDIFWPTEKASSEKKLPYWPNLKYFELTFNIVDSHGSWFIDNDQNIHYGTHFADLEDYVDLNDMGEEETAAAYGLLGDPLFQDNPVFQRVRKQKARIEGYYPIMKSRRIPNDAKMNALAMSMALAVRRMPKLQTMVVSFKIPDIGTDRYSFTKRYVQVAFLMPGNQCNELALDLVPEDQHEARLYISAEKWRPSLEVLRKWSGIERVNGSLLTRYRIYNGLNASIHDEHRH